MLQAVPVQEPERHGMPGHAPHLPQGRQQIVAEAQAGHGRGAAEGPAGKRQLQCAALQVVNVISPRARES